MPNPASFTPTLPVNQVRSNRIQLIEVDNQRLVLTRIEGELCAFIALCPHQLGDLSRGEIHNGEIECPVHAWRFNIRSGHSTYPQHETLRLRRYQVVEEGGVVKVGSLLVPPSD